MTTNGYLARLGAATICVAIGAGMTSRAAQADTMAPWYMPAAERAAQFADFRDAQDQGAIREAATIPDLARAIGVPEDALAPFSLVCKAVSANGKPTVKLSDNPEKATGPADEIARYKRVFGVGAQVPSAVMV